MIISQISHAQIVITKKNFSFGTTGRIGAGYSPNAAGETGRHPNHNNQSSASMTKLILAPTIAPIAEQSIWARPYIRFIAEVSRYERLNYNMPFRNKQFRDHRRLFGSNNKVLTKAKKEINLNITRE